MVLIILSLLLSNWLICKGNDETFDLFTSDKHSLVSEFLENPLKLMDPLPSSTPQHELALQLSNQRQALQSNGWFSTTLCTDSNCNNVVESKGILTNQCLYSSRLQISFTIQCTNQYAELNVFGNTSTCEGSTRFEQYLLNSYIPLNDGLTAQYECTQSVYTLQLPLGYSYVFYEYFPDASCITSMIQYAAYIENLCYLQYPHLSVILQYPKKITYFGSNCQGKGNVTELKANRCFNWEQAYGYGYQDDLDPNSPSLLITYIVTNSYRPSKYPSVVPTIKPTPTFSPTFTPAPTVVPSRAPSALPTISSAPSYSQSPSTAPTIMPSTLIPTLIPTKLKKTPSPTNTVNYQLQILINQEFENLDCGAFVLEDSASLVLDSTIVSSITDQMITTTSNSIYQIIELSIGNNSLATSCNLSYVLEISSTAALGYYDGQEAYTNITTVLSNAVTEGLFTKYWQTYAQQYQLDSFENAKPDGIQYEGYILQAVAPSGPSAAPTSLINPPQNDVSNIITYVFSGILGICCLPLFGFFVMYAFRLIWRYRNKVTLVPTNEGNIEMAEAQYITDEAQFVAIGLTMNQHRVAPLILPEAKPVTGHIIAQTIEV